MRAISSAAVENALVAVPASGSAWMNLRYLDPLQSLTASGSGLADPAFGEEATAKGTVGKQVDTMLLADLRQMPRGAAIDQRKRYLVGNQRDAFGQCEIKMGGIEIGDADFADQALLPEPIHLVQGIEPGGMFEGPPVELQQVDRLTP